MISEKHLPLNFPTNACASRTNKELKYVLMYISLNNHGVKDSAFPLVQAAEGVSEPALG